MENINEIWTNFLYDNGAIQEKNSLSNFEIHFNQKVKSSYEFISPLCHLGILKVTGEDSSVFLQNQLTCNVFDLNESVSLISGYCTPKGRLISTMNVIKKFNDIYLVLPKEILLSVKKRLEMLTSLKIPLYLKLFLIEKIQ